MSRGLVYVVFGKEYDKLAAHAIVYSRQFTDLPICVITNISNRCAKWDEIDGVTFRVVSKHQWENRQVKTCMPRYTPFEKTLYLDCDSVIQKPGIEQAFDMLVDHDIVLSLYLDWKEGDKIVKLAKNVMIEAGACLPLKIYCGAFICWDNSNKKVTKGFFPEWNDLWIRTGRGREMFQLCCAAKKLQLNVRSLESAREKMFHPNAPSDCVVQHNYNSYGDLDFHTEYGLPRIRQCKWFDGDPTDWTWVDFEVTDV